MKKIPFFPNTKDNLHCFQAVMKMLLAYYFPNNNYSKAQLERFTGFRKNYWSWPMRGYTLLESKGLKITRISLFDYRKFINSPKKYLVTFSGENVAREQTAHSDIKQVVADARDFVGKSKITSIVRPATINDIDKYSRSGCLVVVNLNSMALYHKLGFNGHFVIIFHTTGKFIYYHDPGLPPRANHRVRKETFEKAWGFSKNSKNLVAINTFNS